MAENKVSKEQELDTWMLLRKDVDILQKREAKRAAHRRQKRKGVTRNRLAFVPVPELVRVPLILQMLPDRPSSLQSPFVRVVGLDSTRNNMLLQNTHTKLQQWVLPTNSNESENESDTTKSQTVVYDHDHECVPMADWQTTFHVSLCYVLVYKCTSRR
jgi:hypothetical protein